MIFYQILSTYIYPYKKMYKDQLKNLYVEIERRVAFLLMLMIPRRRKLLLHVNDNKWTCLAAVIC